MVESRSSLGLVDEPLYRCWITSEVRREKLECDDAVEFGVLGFVDNAHAASAEFFEDLVVGDGRTAEGSHCRFSSLGEDGLLPRRRVVGVGSRAEVLDQGPAAAALRLGKPSGTDVRVGIIRQGVRNCKEACWDDSPSSLREPPIIKAFPPGPPLVPQSAAPG